MTTETNAALEERNYWRIWAILATLPLMSLAAYLSGIRELAILTSLVVIATSVWFATTSWMHVNLEPRFVPYLCILAFAFMIMFFVMVAPDVMLHRGNNWVNYAAEQHRLHVHHAERSPALATPVRQPEGD